MDSDDLRAFAAFADTLSFTRAAERVHLSQPAVFAVVKRLAEDVGVALYDKRGRALALTRAGERLAAHARDVVDAERALRASLDGEGDGAVCVLACGEGALVHVVGEGVAAFVRAHPRALRVRIADGQGALEAVRRGGAHVAVVAGGAADDDLVARPIRTSRVVAVAAREIWDALPAPPGADRGEAGARRPSSSRARAAAMPIAALARAPLILPPRGRPLRAAVDDALAARGLEATVAVEASGWSALVALARLGCGLALVNDVVPTPGLVARPVSGLAPVVYRVVSRRRRSALAAALVTALASQA